MVAPFLPDAEKVAAIREALPATAAGLYLDAATAGPLPTETDRAMREWAEWELRVGRAGPDADAEFAARIDEARGTVAAILVAPPDRVALAPGPALGLRLAAERRRWREGEWIVLVGALEEPIRDAIGGLARAVGAEVVAVEHPTRVAEALEHGAALLVSSHVSPADGSILPVADIAAAAHDAGAWLAVDGSLAVGAFAFDVPALGADVYVAAGDRWLLGPSGVAVVNLAPGDGDPEAEPARLVDLGDLNRAAVVGLGRSAGWLAMQVGLEWAFERARRLTALLAERLSRIEGVTLLVPPSAVGTILSFRAKGWPADRLREELARRAFAIVGLAGESEAVRVGLGCWNTDEEIERFASAVTELAVTTPDQAARSRPPIVVVSGGGS